MEEYDLFTKIYCHNKSFTKSERKIVEYILELPYEVMYMSITELAQKCEVGEATVFRFCKTLKLNGYQEFKVLLAQAISNKNSSLASALPESVKVSDSCSEVCKKLLNSDINALKSTFEKISDRDIKRAVEILSEAKNIYFYGLGSSSIMAREAYGVFARIIPNVKYEPDSHLQSMSAGLTSKDDAAVFFSYSGSTKEVIDMARLAKANSAKIIAITRFSKSSLTAAADVSLCYSADEGPFQGGALFARIVQIYLLDILYTEFFKCNFDLCNENRKITTSSISSKLL